MNVLGHERQKKVLKEMTEKERVPHFLLFSGSESLGKRKTAKEFVKLLNCKEGEACGKCRYCRKFEKLQLDFLKVSDENEITIDQVRNLQENLSLTSREGGWKTALIDNGHLLNPEAQACLLKTLEEPPGKSVIILVTHHPNLLVDTILSRARRLQFTPVETDLIVDKLIEKGASQQEAEDIAELSLSRPGLAFKLFEDEDFKTEWVERRKDLKKLRNSEFPDRFDYVKDLSKDRAEARKVLKIWLAFLREELFDKLKKGESVEKLVKVIEDVREVAYLISKTNVNLRLSLEKIIINL